MTEVRGELALTPNQQLEWCLGNLGVRLTTATVSPELDAAQVEGWLGGSVPEPAASKVALLYGAAREVSDVYDEQTARAFLRSSNPYAGDDSLLRVIAHGEPEEAQAVVRGAVREFLD